MVAFSRYSKNFEHQMSKGKLLLLFFLCLASVAVAQEKKYEKAVKDVSEGNYFSAYKKLNDVLEHENTRGKAEALLLHAQCLYHLADNPELLKKEPRPLLEALKDVVKAKKKYKGDLQADYGTFLSELKTAVMQQAKEEFDAARYNSALRYYEKLYELDQENEPLFMQAKVSYKLQDTATAIEKIGTIVKQTANAAEVSKVPPFSKEPFLIYVNHFLDRQKFDTGFYYAQLTYELFPAADTARKLLLKALLLESTHRAPNMSTLGIFASWRDVFAGDSLFAHKENVLFLYLLNNHANQGNNMVVDSLLSGFIDIKHRYYAAKGETYARQDALYNRNGNEILFNLIRYTAKFERKPLLRALINNYVSGNYADSSFRKQTAAQQWKALFARFEAEHSAFLLYTAFPLAQMELQKESWFAAYKKQTLFNAVKNQKTYEDRTAIISLVNYVISQYPADKAIREESRRQFYAIAAEYLDAGIYSHAKLSIDRIDHYFPADAGLPALKKDFAQKDFTANYFGSAVKNYEWNGNEALCKVGAVPQEIQDKVAQRINYFRRTAGVPDYVVLDKEKSRMCQHAALIYQVNNKKATAPGETWKCFSLPAIEASRMSARIFGQTTVLAVTSIMADLGEKNNAVGNRRWLLYPPAMEMGHGSTSKMAVVWTIDDAGNKDTTEYMQKFVAWPPKDYCPAMFAFERWSFSLYADFSKAVVTMSTDGKEVPLVQEAPVPGYGIPTLVWKPQGIEKPEKGEKVYTVTIRNVLTGKGKKPETYSYRVILFSPAEHVAKP